MKKAINAKFRPSPALIARLKKERAGKASAEEKATNRREFFEALKYITRRKS